MDGFFGLHGEHSASFNYLVLAISKPYWKVNMWIHRVSGTIIACLTIALGIVGIKLVDWELEHEDPHHVIGLICFFTVLFVAVGGVFARSRTRRFTKIVTGSKGSSSFIR